MVGRPMRVVVEGRYRVQEVEKIIINTNPPKVAATNDVRGGYGDDERVGDLLPGGILLFW